MTKHDRPFGFACLSILYLFLQEINDVVLILLTNLKNNKKNEMGKYEVGVLGNFDGKIGTVVGARWKGIEYMRHKGRKSKKPRSEAQLDHQAKFGCVAKFINRFDILLMTCYPDTPKQTGINQAFAQVYADAVVGAYPTYGLDYSKIAMSKGDLHNANQPVAAAAGGGIIKFSWNDNTDGLMARAEDRSVLIVYCPELNQANYTLTGPRRSEGSATLNVMNFAGKEVQTWITFLSAKGMPATSIYTGQLIVD